ncbi:hypothetical protein DL766_006286 [Monosporascus sp. MC13-8B]|uniref:RRM domain-containing protein n=1 Tax=Monosporascus cannonballus TaxID=155416 RepID=A0ABY0H9W9_9PEZI|nr:hypothetical protein DL762_003839 [Monosporascus cannonballus]RYP27691.1 hypothetical protein DL766_006286 [Monosporascus sp. MC13-8B]
MATDLSFLGDNEPSNLRIDPAIWYSPRRCLQTGSVKSLFSDSPPPAPSAHLPRYLRDGLALKHNRTLELNNPVPQPPSPQSSCTQGTSSDVLGYLDSFPLERIRPNISYAPRGARELNASRAINLTAPLRPERQPQNPPPSSHMRSSSQRFSQEGQSQSLTPFEAQLDPTSYLNNTSRPNQPGGLSPMAPVFTPRAYAPPAPFQPRFALGIPPAPPSSRTVPPPPLEPRVPPSLPWRARRPTVPTAPPRRSPSRYPSSNYRGDPNNPNNQSADIPERQSTAIYVEGLPADCTVRELLLAARGTGKLWASNVSPPTPPEHPGSCGKLVFWTRAGADRLLAMHAGGRFLVRGAAPTVKMNRWRSAARPEGDPRSRVVVVRGPARVVNRPYLDAFFGRGEPGPKFDWDTDEVVVRPHAREGWAELEYRFACHRAQASEAYRWIMIASGRWQPNEKEKRALGRDFGPEERDLWAGVKVSWGTDPCDPNPGPPEEEGEAEE